jgi:cytochrome P450
MNTMPVSFWFITFILTSEKYYPLVMQRIHSHIKQNGNLSTGDLFNIDNLLNDPFLQACFQETLRLRTHPTPFRIVYESTTLPIQGKQYQIRKGTIISIPSFLIHQDTQIFTNINEFNPSRFLETNIENSIIQDPSNLNLFQNLLSTDPPKFFKNGIPVRHYLLSFGGGENKVLFLFVR